MNAIQQTIVHTPAWVWVVFAGLLWLGWQRLKPRSVRLLRLFVLPAIFLAWGMAALVTRDLPLATLASVWIGGAVLGFVAGHRSARVGAMRRTRAAGIVHLPGNPASLAVILIEFFGHYGLAVASARIPALAPTLAPWDVALSGFGAGFFVGWLRRVLSAYPGLPEAGTPPSEAASNIRPA